MKTLLVSLFLFILMLPVYATGGIVCFNYGQGVISCDGDNLSNTTQIPFGPNGGVLSTDKGLEPYTIFAPPPTRRDSSSFRSQPIIPLDLGSSHNRYSSSYEPFSSSREPSRKSSSLDSLSLSKPSQSWDFDPLPSLEDELSDPFNDPILQLLGE